MGTFHAAQNQYLVFEDGPSVDVDLQWATYRDASDQCSLSRIWGGIHPPIDDMPGRLMGRKIGPQAFALAERFFNGQILGVAGARPRPGPATLACWPNPVARGRPLTVGAGPSGAIRSAEMFSVLGQRVASTTARAGEEARSLRLDTGRLRPGVYLLRVRGPGGSASGRVLVLE